MRTWATASISKFSGMRKIVSLQAQPISDKLREQLTERGRTYTKLAGVQFL